jgi:hypothetical protein
MPVASIVRLRAGGQLGSPPAMGPPAKSSPWQPVYTAARCRRNSTETSAAGGTALWAASCAPIGSADRRILPVATRTLPSGPSRRGATKLSTGGCTLM